MSAVTRLRSQGLDVRLTHRQTIAIRPADKLPDEWRTWIAENRQWIISELLVQAANDGNHERLVKRWKWFLSLATDHGIHPDVVAAEYPTEQDRLDVVEPSVHTDELLRSCMATQCRDISVIQRQQEYDAGSWMPVLKTDS